MAQERGHDLVLPLPELSASPSPLSSEGVSKTKKSKLKTYLTEDLRVGVWWEIELFILAFGIGVQDVTIFPEYAVFASNQTGNTVFLAIQAAGVGDSKTPYSNIGFSLAFFLAGSATMGRLGYYLGPKKRWWLFVTNLIQTLLVVAATIIQYKTPITKTGAASWSVLSTLAFSCGAQIAMTRGLGVTEISTTLITLAYVDLAADLKLFRKKNRGRNRRIGFIISVIGGAFTGAFAKREVNSAFCLLLSACLKIGVTFAIALNPAVETKPFV